MDIFWSSTNFNKKSFQPVLQEGLCQQCTEAMMETINKTTVCTYYAAATQYCEDQLQTKCVEWLERRVTSETSVTLLKDIR